MKERPISLTVFGILNIGYALWTVVSMVMSAFVQRMNLPGNNAMAALKSNPSYILWTQISYVVAVIFGIVLIASGVGLLLTQNWARILAIIYAALDMVFVVAGGIFSQLYITPMIMHQIHGGSNAIAEVGVKIGFAIGLIIGLAYPVLLLIFMTRPNVIEACASAEHPIEKPLP
jgi:hypothetical protein